MENFRLCRICISESAVMMSIFGEDALWKKIASLANVHIQEGDNLPQQICVICANNAINASSFKEKCEEADAYFRNTLIRKVERCDVVSISSDDDDNDDNSSCQLVELITENESNIETINEDSTPLPNGCGEPLWTSTPVQNPKDKFKEPLIPNIRHNTPKDTTKNPQTGYQCSICFQHFAMKTILKHHMKQNHPDCDKTYQCFECKRNYNSQRFLEKHVRMGTCTKKSPPSRSSTYKNGTGSSVTDNRFDSPTENSSESDKKIQKYQKTKRGKLILSESQIALIKSLIEQDEPLSIISKHLNVSKSCAWRLRKNFIEEIKTNGTDREVGGVSIAQNGNIELIESHNTETMQTDNSQGSSYAFTEQLDPLDIGLEEEEEQHDEMIPLTRPGCSQHEETEIDVCQIEDNDIQDDYGSEKLEEILKKPRKPNVFIDNEKYAQAKLLIASNATTMDIARKLDISQMSAWKLRDCILRGVPLKFRKPSAAPRSKSEMEKNVKIPYRRLKGEEKEERDKQVTQIILSLLREDNGIQYWRVSEHLREKGFPISPSAVCQKLKSLGIHRRWKQPTSGNSSESDQSRPGFRSVDQLNLGPQSPIF